VILELIYIFASHREAHLTIIRRGWTLCQNDCSSKPASSMDNGSRQAGPQPWPPPDRHLGV